MPPLHDSVRLVRAAGLNWRVATRGSDTPGRPPLVLINGLGASLEIWQPFVDHLPSDLPVIRFDAPGVGGTDALRRPLPLKGVAGLVDSLLSELDVSQADVLGISWGGLLAQHLAAWSPHRCRRLVLVSTVPCMGARPAGFDVAREMLSRRRYVDPQHAAQVAGRLYGGAVRHSPELAATLHRGIPATTVGYRHQLFAALTAAGPPFYPGIQQPTLILSGDDDPLIPLANARILRAAIPNSRLRVFPDGHLGLFTAAMQLAPSVDAFLRRERFAGHGRVQSAAYLAAATARHVMGTREQRRRRGDETAADHAA